MGSRKKIKYETEISIDDLQKYIGKQVLFKNKNGEECVEVISGIDDLRVRVKIGGKGASKNGDIFYIKNGLSDEINFFVQ